MANSPNAQPLQVGNGAIPASGPAVIPFTIPFATNAVASYVLDLRGIQQLAYIKNLQAIFVDNSANPSSLSITVSTTNQTIVFPPQSQGYVPLLFSNNLLVTFASTGAVNVPVFPLNFPVAPAVWTVGGTGTIIGGNLQVADSILDGAVSGGFMQAQQYVVGQGGKLYPQTVGNVTVNGTQNAASGAVLITGSPGYVITGIQLQLSEDATLAAAGPLVVTGVDSSSGAIWRAEFGVPNAASVTTPGQIVATPGSFVWNNKANASTFQLNQSAALATGHLSYNISYALATYVG